MNNHQRRPTLSKDQIMNAHVPSTWTYDQAQAFVIDALTRLDWPLAEWTIMMAHDFNPESLEFTDASQTVVLARSEGEAVRKASDVVKRNFYRLVHRKELPDA